MVRYAQSMTIDLHKYTLKQSPQKKIDYMTARANFFIRLFYLILLLLKIACVCVCVFVVNFFL